MTLPLPEPLTKNPRCMCFGDTMAAEGIDGELRPCSRCNFAEFDKWAAARRKPEPNRVRAVKDAS